MNPFQLGQFKVGRLLSYLMLELTQSNSVEKRAPTKQTSSKIEETMVHTVPMYDSRFAGGSPKAVLRTAEQRWPSRYY